jgi:diguanylate cyclase (GGDEF)-like protein
MKKLEKHRDLLFSTLAEINSLIIAGNDKKIIIERLLDCSLQVLDAERIHLLELTDPGIVKYSKSSQYGGVTEMKIESINDTANVRQWVMKEGGQNAPDRKFEKGEELAFDVPLLTHQFLEEEPSNRTIISAPLVAKKSMFGLLLAIHQDDGMIYTAEDINLLTVLANHAAIAVENALLYQKLEREAITDGLTSVYNYRFLLSSMEAEIKRARRFRQHFSYVMLDVDNLKSYNDKRGHLSGSQALKEIADLITSTCREIDLVYKYGGDEFGILLPQTDVAGAATVTQRVLRAVAKHRFNNEVPGLLTCSAGISSFPRDGESVKDLISAADKALYQAKRSGKNLVLTSEDLIKEYSE